MNTSLSKFSGRIKFLLLVVTLSALSVGLVGCDGSFNIPPTAVIVDTVNSQSGNVTFDLSQSSDPDGSILSYKFYPQYETDQSKVITDTEVAMTPGGWASITESPSPGEYTAKLIVTDDEGGTGSATDRYIVDW